MNLDKPLPPIVTRALAGLCLLLWLALPVGFIAAIWTAEERWLWTGMTLFGIGFGLGWLLTQTPKPAPPPASPDRYPAPTRTEIGEQR